MHVTEKGTSKSRIAFQWCQRLRFPARDLDVVNERLISRLTNSTEWERFEAVGECEPILSGLGNADRMQTDWFGGFEGYSLRLFDRATGKWSIYWADSNGARLLPPVVGEFVNGVGEFYGEDQGRGATCWSVSAGGTVKRTRPLGAGLLGR